MRGTARELGLDRKVVKRWVDRSKTHRQPVAIAKSGRPRGLSPQHAALAIKWLTLGGMTSGAVARKLHEEGYTPHQLHRTTVIRHAKRVARERGERLRPQTGKPAVMLTLANKQARLRFAQSNRSRDWSRVMFTDRKKFQLRHPGSSVGPVTWTVGDRRRSALRVTRPATVNVYAGLTVHGVTQCHVVTGTTGNKSSYLNMKGEPARNITSSEYKDVVSKTFIPEGDRLFGGRGVTPNWVLQQDNDPTHKVARAEVVTRNRARLGNVELLSNWPPNSPDLNIIENLWSMVDAKLQARACKTAAEFKQAVLDEMRAVPLASIKALFDSLPGRMKKVISNGGSRLGY